MSEVLPASGAVRPPVLSVALVSMAALGYEILLMRLFSIIQWHHFAFMIISLALLGYGISGTLVTLLRERLQARFAVVYSSCMLAFGVSAVLCFLVAQRLPFNAELVLWDIRQTFWLLLQYLLLTLPFLCAATALALVLVRFDRAIGRIYAWDLAGAGTGGLLVIVLLLLLAPLQALLAIGLLGVLAGAVAAHETMLSGRHRLYALLVLAALVLSAASLLGELQISPYKSLNQTLRIPGTRIIDQSSGPLGLVSVVESSEVPLRYAPGLSLLATQEPPSQLGVFTDGEAMTAINRDSGMQSALAWLGQSSSALPYAMQRPQHVLVLGAGTGQDVQQAIFHGVPRVTAVELNPQIIGLVRERYADYAGHLYQRVDVREDEARGFIAGSSERYDLIQMALFDAFGATATGLNALNESHLYTIEALQDYLAHLQPDGCLSITRWVTLPPRDILKLFATALDALSRQGVQRPADRLVLVRSWQTATLLVKNSPFSADELQRMQDFVERWGFDLAWYPGMQPDQANRYNRLREPYFYQAAVQLAGAGRAAFLADYKFDLRPATDNRPYFFHFFKWRVLPEILNLRGQGGLPLLEWGYLVLVVTLALALLASVLLILLPLLALPRRRGRHGSGLRRWRVFGYFSAVGLAFLFIEMAFIQRFMLLLHHPVYAAATTLTGFLVFAGLGSRWSQHRAGQPGSVLLATAGIVLLALLELVLLDQWLAALAAWPLVVRMLFTLLLIAPLAFCMGMPFPLGLTRVAAQAPELVPWAWGVNGCASVVSAVLATLLALHLGSGAVILAAVLLYMLAALLVPAAGAAGRTETAGA